MRRKDDTYRGNIHNYILYHIHFACMMALHDGQSLPDASYWDYIGTSVN